jgi:hypothetical protein
MKSVITTLLLWVLFWAFIFTPLKEHGLTLEWAVILGQLFSMVVNGIVKAFED